MPQNVTDSSVFTDPIVQMADADPLDPTYVRTAVQGLANRTRYLYDKVAVSREIVLADAVAGWDPGPPSPTWAQLAEGGTPTPRWFSLVNGGAGVFARLWIPVPLVRGDKVTDVYVAFKPGAVRTGTNKMSFSLLTYTVNRSTGAWGGPGAPAGAAQADDGTTNGQHVHFAITSPPYTAIDGETLWISVNAGNTGAAAPDAVHGGHVLLTP